MSYNRKYFGKNIQYFIKHILENKYDDITFVTNILTIDNAKNFIKKWNEITNSNITYSSLIRNFSNYNIKCISIRPKIFYEFPKNFKLDGEFNRVKFTPKTYLKNDRKLAFIKTFPIHIFQLLKKNGCIDYSGFIKSVKLSPEEEVIINNTEMMFNLYDNGLIHK